MKGKVSGVSLTEDFNNELIFNVKMLSFKPSPWEESLLSPVLYLIQKYRDLSRYFTKSFTRFFSKNRGVLGQSPKVFLRFFNVFNVYFFFSFCYSRCVFIEYREVRVYLAYTHVTCLIIPEYFPELVSEDKK